jgi:hypothetical protein
VVLVFNWNTEEVSFTINVLSINYLTYLRYLSIFLYFSFWGIILELTGTSRSSVVIQITLSWCQRQSHLCPYWVHTLKSKLLSVKIEGYPFLLCPRLSCLPELFSGCDAGSYSERNRATYCSDFSFRGLSCLPDFFQDVMLGLKRNRATYCIYFVFLEVCCRKGPSYKIHKNW